MTLQERQLIFLLRWWVGLFAAAGVVFVVWPGEVVYWINASGRTIFNWPYAALPLPAEHFWQVLAVSLLAVLTVTAYIAQHDIRQNYSYVILIIVSKFVTTFGYLMAVIFSGPYFAYVTGMTVDFVILILTLFCYSRAVGSRVI